jgi:hypothetical protein
MQVDQAGHDDQAGRVDHVHRPCRCLAAGSVRALADGGDPVSVDHHVPAEVHGPLIVHRQDGAVLDHDHCAAAPHI